MGEITKEMYPRFRPTYQSAIINTTNACNFACRYCFTEPNPTFLSAEKGKQIIDFVFDGWKKNKGKYAPPDFNFFGGEPLLRFDETMVPMIDYLRNEKEKELQKILPGQRFVIGVTTNGSLLTPERAVYLAKNEVGILLSIDGGKETQDHNRPFLDGRGSFDILEEKIPMIRELFPGTTFRSTISAAMAKNLLEDFCLACDYGFTGYFCTPNVHEEWSDEQLEILKGQILGVFLTQYQMITDDVSYPKMTFIDTAYTNFFRKDSCLTCKRCGLGTTSIAFDANGRIFGCQEQATKCENLFYLGSVDEGFDEERHRKLLNHIVKYDEVRSDFYDCNQCGLKDICVDHYCPSTNYTITDDPQKMPKMYCWWKKTLNDCAAYILSKAEKEENLLFKDYLNNILGVK